MASTREKLRQLVIDHPEWTRSDLARALGVSRERVRQLLIAEDLDAAEYTGKPLGRAVPDIAISQAVKALEHASRQLESAKAAVDNAKSLLAKSRRRRP